MRPLFLLASSQWRTLALTPLESAVEHPMKDASPACPEPRRREEASRPKGLSLTVSALECAVTENRALSSLECTLTKTRPYNSFKMRSYEKRWGEGVSLTINSCNP